MRLRHAIAPLFIATLVLAGCSSSPESAPQSTDDAASDIGTCVDTSSGAASESVTVEGEKGAAPTATFDAPLTVDTTERTIISEGDGAEAKHGSWAGVEVTLYNAETGEKVQSSSYAGAPMQVMIADNALVPALVRAIECVPAGSRVVSVSPASDAWGEQGTEDGAIGPGDGVVIVADVVSLTPETATGEPQEVDPSLPEVTLDDSGAPTVTIPSTDPPEEFQLGVLKKGDGTTVEDGDTVTVQYQGVNWRTGEVFDQSWGDAPAQFGTDQVIAGFTKALVGQTVGSQVIAVIPPEDGYGEAGSDSAGIKGTDTLVFVVDILATSR
ncbi:FKBP-type peptidyl-prolyl cis-trans isomerase [Microbacterium sp. MPKO10]|uniref:FKBP-type peptidyl-prolyl cis-trans isomerase n=1 Tax=Microbacterium sp. MPKO10 TaxID=2989818 RepID=UPI0022359ACD|nr:FKBP-type peptidyl-prolyl cis-trans isomerase [Microbacterium sp. MPKO10]MCW4458352.1 FKBP-type peptidyl-prolyl cis-trans isomerase [Microbacterium sp. MPKO10]